MLFGQTSPMPKTYFSDSRPGSLRSSLANLFVEINDSATAATVFDSYPKHRLVSINNHTYIALVPHIVTELTNFRYYATLLAGEGFVRHTFDTLKNETHISATLQKNIGSKSIQEGTSLLFSLPALYFIEHEDPKEPVRKTVSCFVAGHRYAKKPHDSYYFIDGSTVTENIISIHPKYETLAVLVVGTTPPYARVL